MSGEMYPAGRPEAAISLDMGETAFARLTCEMLGIPRLPEEILASVTDNLALLRTHWANLVPPAEEAP